MITFYAPTQGMRDESGEVHLVDFNRDPLSGFVITVCGRAFTGSIESDIYLSGSQAVSLCDIHVDELCVECTGVFPDVVSP